MSSKMNWRRPRSLNGQKYADNGLITAELKAGTPVTIFNFDGHRYFVEGKATILRTTGYGRGRYIVRFPNGLATERFVDTKGQEDPEAYLESINLGHISAEE
jgi:hypothetical protein